MSGGRNTESRDAAPGCASLFALSFPAVSFESHKVVRVDASPFLTCGNKIKNIWLYFQGFCFTWSNV